MLQKLACGLLCVAAFAVAAPPTGTVNANGSFKLNGTDIPATAAVSTPLNLGDQIRTDTAPAVVRLDWLGAVITVAPNSLLDSGDLQGKPYIRLVEGRLDYKLTPGSDLLIFKAADPVKTGTSGVVKFASSKKPVAIAAAGGAAATVTGVALAKRSKTCPDGQPKTKDCGNN